MNHATDTRPRSQSRSTMAVYLIASLVCFLVACGGQSGTSPTPGPSASTGPYFVSTSGNDRNAGTIDSPWRSLSRATQSLRPGDTLYLRGGTYSDSFNNPPLVGGSWSNPIRIAAYAGEKVWISPPTSAQYAIYLDKGQQYVEFDGINIDGVATRTAPVRIEGYSGGNAHHIRIKNAEIVSGGDGIANQGTNGGPHGILASASSSGVIGGNEFQNLSIRGGGDPGDFAYGFYLQSNDNLVENCDVSDTSGAGIQIYNGAGYMPSNNIIRNNRIHDIRRSADDRIWGILVVGNNTQIIGNTLQSIGRSGSTGAAIDVYRGSGTVIGDNTISGSRPVAIYVEDGAADTVVRNNAGHDNAMDFLDRGANTVWDGVR